MPEKFSTSNSYTPAEQLALWEECSAQIAVSGQSYTIGNRSYTAADADVVLRMIDYWRQRLNDDSAPATNLVKFVRR